MKKIILLAIFSFSTYAGAVEVHTANVQRLRVHSISHPLVSVRHFTAFTINRALIGDCGWLFIKPEDTESLSVLLMAKAQGSNLLIGYDETIKSPWDFHTCGVIHLELM